MTIKFEERPGTRRSTSNPPSFEVGYLCTGVFDTGAAKFLGLSLTAPQVAVEEGILWRQDIRVEEQGYQLHHVTAVYGPQTNQVGSVRLSGSTTGGSFHITHSKGTAGRYPFSAVDHQQAINVRKRGQDLEIDGSDIVIPALKLSYTIRNPAGYINESYARAVARVTGCMNADIWHGFEPGEVLFLGVDFSAETGAEADATYYYACEENLSGLIIGSITGIQKLGHDLLWVSWEDDNTAGRPATKPTAVYVERVYRPINFTQTFAF